MSSNRVDGFLTSVLDPDLIPSPLLEASETPEVRIVPLRKTGRLETLRLFRRVIGFGLVMLWARFARRATPAERAVQFRNFLEDLGGLWVKAGQLLALRSDLFSREMLDELSQLAYRAHGFAPEIARQIVEDSIGGPIESEFAVFEELPFAAASISQVHRARLRRDGTLVAVKVQRPAIADLLKRDLGVIKTFTRIGKHLPMTSYIPFDGLVTALNRVFLEEVDYRYEVSNLRRLRKTLREHNVYVPKVYRRISGRQIIAMEFIEGVLMSDYSRIQATDPARAQQWCEENDIVPRSVGSRLMRSFYRQLFEDNIFHGDLHPGNIVLLRDSRFALIDLGSVGMLEKKFLEYYRQMQKAFAEGDYSKSVDFFLLQVDHLPPIDTGAFKAELIDLYREWEARTHLAGLTYHEKSLSGGIGNKTGEVMRRYRIQPSWEYLQMGRAMATLDANLTTLLGDANPNRIMQRYFREASERARRNYMRDLPRRIASALTETHLGVELASQQLRQGAMRVSGIQRKVDVLMASIMNTLRLVLIIVALFVAYDQLLAHGWLPAWARFDFLDEWARRVDPYPAEWAVLFVLFIVYLIRHAGRVRRRYSQPAVTLPDNRLAG